MNKKYQVDREGKITVITNTGETIERKDKYTKNTDEILSLENVIELLENKVNNLKKYLEEFKKKIKNKKSNIISMPLFFLTSLGLVYLVSSSLLLVKMLGIAFAIGGTILLAPEFIQILKGKKEIKKYEQRIKEESYRTKKINKRINTLSKDKTPTKIDKVNEFIEVKTITNFNFDVSDYFIEKYQIDKRTKQMTNSKKKVRKLTKKDDNPYII